jgi:hypothetical protein
MADATLEQLMRIESRLTQSFFAAVVSLVAYLIWVLFIAAPASSGGMIPQTTTGIVLAILQLVCYIWYAVAAGAGATAIGESGWKYVIWILAAPFLSRLPIPIVSTLIAASPLAIKFLLGGQLQSTIRSTTFNEFHRSS